MLQVLVPQRCPSSVHPAAGAVLKPSPLLLPWASYFLFFEVLSLCSKQDSQVFLIEDPLISKLKPALVRLPDSDSSASNEGSQVYLSEGSSCRPKSLCQAVQTPPPAPFLDRLHHVFLAFSRIPGSPVPILAGSPVRKADSDLAGQIQVFRVFPC